MCTRVCGWMGVCVCMYMYVVGWVYVCACVCMCMYVVGWVRPCICLHMLFGTIQYYNNKN
jgi:hypothetical protein